MSIIRRNTNENKDVELGTNISNRASHGSNTEDSSLKDAIKDNVNEGGVASLGLERKKNAASAKKDPFGDEEDSDVKNVALLMIAETISLGILSLPSVLATIGLVPGIIVIVGLGIAATYTGYVIGQFKAQYPHVHNMADAGEVLLGAVGREVFGIAQITFLVFIMGSHVLTFSIMLNVLSNHGACTILFAVIGMIVSIIFSLPRTLKKVSYFSIACEY
ncbi:hypothetical protein GP486_006353 [Trichoglossum hirsutum]|uniref:Amino acid transporter transmembrane domain-containing protein n=1 Tax=Trichoglossum hirsutum TaxID=265104 RepID=A0A9P8IDU5_9PEZI|nr:hypothetical protein GP486_006353 [Trichoglossum hirsutum]